MIELGMVTIDTTDARALAQWWAERLNGEIVEDMEGWFCIIAVPGMPVQIGFQKVDDPTPGKNRLHLDFAYSAGTNREQAVGEWVAAGATHLGYRGEEGFHWDTFTDPAGNEFCIGDPH